MAMIFGAMAVFGVIALIIGIAVIVGQWKVLQKGNKPGWGAIIPFYNTYLMCDMVGVNPWWILIVVLSPILGVVPVIGSLATMAVSIYFTILLNVSIAKAFGKETGFAVGLILLPPVFWLILGLGKENNYVGKNPMKDILFDNINQNNNSNVKEAEYEENAVNCPSCGSKVPANTKYCPKCGKEL